MGASVLVRGGRLVGLDGEGERVADVRIVDGVVTEVGVGLTGDEPVLDAAGGWVIPGLWDAHVHAEQWIRSTTWVDLSGTAGPEEVVARIAAALDQRPDDGRVVVGFGYRSGPWERVGTVAELDAVSGGRPVVCIAGDAHNGWLNSAALDLMGLPAREGPLVENEWFPVFGRLDSLPGTEPTDAEVDAALARLSSRGLVGLVDLEFSGSSRTWLGRVARGVRSLRVRTGVYPGDLDAIVERGWRSGEALPGGEGLITMGPLKIIGDGSMGTRTAWCCEPYAGVRPDDEHPCGAPNQSVDQMEALLRRAHAAGLEVAVHAIGDRANQAALDAFAATGARGSVEHAQLLRREDVARFAELGVRASVQPHHLVADRDAAGQVWPDRTDRLYLTRSLLEAGAELVLGSDAPVSPPDPWLAIAVAVHRSGDDRPAWHGDEALTPLQALAASVDGGRLAPGARGDVVVLGADPLDAANLLDMPVRVTVCAGRVTHREA